MLQAPSKGDKVHLSLWKLDGFKYLNTKRLKNLYSGMSPEIVKTTGSTVYMIDDYYYPISSLLIDYMWQRKKHYLRLMILLLSKRVEKYFYDNNLDTVLLPFVLHQYKKKLIDVFKPRIDRYLDKKNLDAYFEKYRDMPGIVYFPTNLYFEPTSEDVFFVRNTFWKTVFSTDKLMFNPNWWYSYPVYLEFLTQEREQESLYYQRAHMKHDVDYLLTKKTLLANFEPLKKFLWGSINSKDFKSRIFSYMYLFEYHWKLTAPDFNFGKLPVQHFKHFPEFKMIQDLYSSKPKFRTNYEEFKVVADNHMYCGYLDFVDDLKDFKVPEVK